MHRWIALRYMAPAAIALSLALGSEISVAWSTTTAWWIDGEGDWDVGSNWNLGVPESDERTYITTSEDTHTPDAGDPIRVIFDDSSGSTRMVGPLYVGGWHDQFNADHGSPVGHFGELDIEDGHLKSESTTGTPGCGYMYVATGGARGTVNHSGGTFESCTVLPISYNSGQYVDANDDPDVRGFGTYNLSGGTVDVFGVGVGSQGTGLFDMTGGVLLGSGNHAVGRGYNNSQTGFRPGIGMFNQEGGTLNGDSLQLGRETGSVGSLAVRDNVAADVNGDRTGVEDGLEVRILDAGFYGTGGVVQTGGTVKAWQRLRLGVKRGSMGSYSIAGGSLSVGSGSTNNGVWVGSTFESNSFGNFIVIGSKPSIDVDGSFHIKAGCRLTAILEDDAAISTIDVEDDAIFEAGSFVDVDLAGSDGAGGGQAPFASATDEQVFTLMTVGGSISDGGLSLDADDTDWKLDVDTGAGTVSVAYCPNPPYSSGPCS